MFNSPSPRLKCFLQWSCCYCDPLKRLLSRTGLLFWMEATAHCRNMQLSYWNKWCTVTLPYLGEETTLHESRFPTGSLQQQLWQSVGAELKIWFIFWSSVVLNALFQNVERKKSVFCSSLTPMSFMILGRSTVLWNCTI